MFIEVVVLAFVVAWIRGGRLKTDIGIRHMWLAPVAYAIQLINMFLLPPSVQEIFTIISYVLLFFLAWVNLDRLGIRVMLAGTILNVLVLAVNGMRMPVDLEKAQRLGINVDALTGGMVAKHQALSAASHLPFLGDVVPVPYPLPRLISIGDVFIIAGAFLLIQDIMGKPVRLWSEGSGKKPETSLRGDIG